MSNSFATPWTVACQALLSREETGVGCHSLCQGIFPTQGSNLHLVHWQVASLPRNHQGSTSHSQVLAMSRILGKIGLQWDLHNLSLFLHIVPPMAKVMRLRGRTGKGESGLKGASLDLLVHLPPKPESACLTALCFSLTLLTLTGAVPPHLPLKGINLELQLISLLGVKKMSRLKPL